MSITIKATGNDGGSVNLTVQSGIGPVGPNAALIGGTGVDVTYANGEATLDLNATLATLTDVSAAAPSPGQVLEWNGTAWAPAADSTLALASATPSSLGTAAVGTSAAAAREDHVHAMPSLGSLTDVTLTSPSSGEVLTWNGTAWTAAADSSNFTGYATESYVDSAVSNLVDSSPAALDTLNELAAALGDDANFAANVTASLAGKAAADHSHLKSNITDLTTSDLDLGGSRVLFANVYSTLGDLPDASTYHGMFAHVHAAGAAYYAHAGQWVELADADHGHTSAEIADFATAAAANAPLQGINNLVGNVTVANGTGLTLETAGSTLTLAAALPPSNLADLADVSGSPTDNQALIYNGTQWQPGEVPAGTTINTLSGDLTLASGAGITIETSGSTLTLSAALPPSNIGELADVSADSPSVDQILVYNGTAWGAANVSNVATSGNYSDLVGIPSEFPPTGHSHTRSDITDLTTSDLDMGGNRVLFGNVYSTLGDLPDAATYHGMFAHVHSAAAAYYAHAGVWVRLADDGHSHEIANVSGLQSAIDAKADATSLANIATSGSYSDLAGIPSEFTPATHNHTASDITDLDTAVVTSIDGLAGAVNIIPGANIEISSSGQNLTVSAKTGSGDGVAGVSSVNAIAGAVTIASGGGLGLSVSGSTITLTAEEAGIQWVSPPPSNSESNGTAGDVSYDSDYLYIAVADNDWRRVALQAWGVATTTITSQPQNASLLLGDSATFTVAATSSDGSEVSYQWQTSTDGVTYSSLSGETTASLTVTPQQSDTGRYYRATAQATSGPAATSDAARLTVTTESHRLLTESGDSIAGENGDLLRTEQANDLPNLLTEGDNRLTTENLEPLRI